MCDCCSHDLNPKNEPRIVEFGPHRVIGLNYKGKNENQEIKELWNEKTGLWSRMKEIQTNESDLAVVGICRCLPEATDGSFEYIAALSVKPDAKVPDGMVEADIPSGTYAVLDVDGLDKIHQAWADSMKWLNENPEWDNYCDQARGFCECASHPSFELYPEEFVTSGKFFIYLPIHKK